MSAKVDAIKLFAQAGYDRLGRATKDLKKDHLDWKSVEQANSIRWILSHMSQEANVLVPRIVKGDTSYTPAGWPADYINNPTHSVESLLADIEKGKTGFLASLDTLKDSDLDVDIDFYGGKRKRGAVLVNMVSEVIHHEGQISAILGLMKRMEQKK